MSGIVGYGELVEILRADFSEVHPLPGSNLMPVVDGDDADDAQRRCQANIPRRGAHLDPVDIHFGNEADEADRVEIQHPRAERARLKQRSDLGGVGFEKAPERRADLGFDELRLDQLELRS